MNYNRVFIICAATVVTLLIIGIYFLGNATNIMQHETTEEIQLNPVELND